MHISLFLSLYFSLRYDHYLFCFLGGYSGQRRRLVLRVCDERGALRSALRPAGGPAALCSKYYRCEYTYTHMYIDICTRIYMYIYIRHVIYEAAYVQGEYIHAMKGAHFVHLCAQRGVPLLFVQNITGAPIYIYTYLFGYHMICM